MHALAGDDGLDTSPRCRIAGAAGVVALHGAAALMLWQFEPVRQAMTEPVPIMVRLLPLPVTVTPPQRSSRPLPVQPRPEPRRSADAVPGPIVTADAPAPAVTPRIDPVAPQLVAADLPPSVAAPSAVLVAPVSVPVVPPSFHADYLDNPSPAYPALARRRGEQGRVVLRVLVHPRGTPDTVELRTSSGSGLLDTAALDAVRRWRFVPARQGDQPVAAWVLVPVSFTLEGR